MKEITKTIYVAEDGKEFVNKNECEKYENDALAAKEAAIHFNAIIKYCASHCNEINNGSYIDCNNQMCPFYHQNYESYCKFNCIPYIDFDEIEV